MYIGPAVASLLISCEAECVRWKDDLDYMYEHPHHLSVREAYKFMDRALSYFLSLIHI